MTWEDNTQKIQIDSWDAEDIILDRMNDDEEMDNKISFMICIHKGSCHSIVSFYF